MKKRRFTEEENIGFLKEGEPDASVRDLRRRDGLSDAACYCWGPKVGEVQGGVGVHPVPWTVSR